MTTMATNAVVDAATVALSQREQEAMKRRRVELDRREREASAITAERKTALARHKEEDRRNARDAEEIAMLRDPDVVRARRTELAERTAAQLVTRAQELERWEQQDLEREERMDEEDAVRRRELAHFVPDLIAPRGAQS